MKWISVKDRLPGNELLLLVIRQKKIKYYYHYCGGYLKGVGFLKEGKIIKKVTHWMPLPDPPQEEGSHETGGV